MTLLSSAAFLVMLPVTMLGDGCLFIAIGLAATMGGKPWRWGLAFGAAHLFYSSLGAAMISEVAGHSEFVGDALVLVGSLLLMRHFLHHRIHHSHGESCECDHSHHEVGMSTIIPTAAVLSFHAVASGALLRQMVGDTFAWAVIPVLLGTALMIGMLVTAAVMIGETERRPITQLVDRIPGLVAGILVLICCSCLFHLLEHVLPTSQTAEIVFWSIAGIAAIGVGYAVHDRTPEELVRISKKA